jgi:hypothetical protein
VPRTDAVLAERRHARHGHARRAEQTEGFLHGVLALHGVRGAQNLARRFLAEHVRRQRRRPGGGDPADAIDFVRRVGLPVAELRDPQRGGSAREPGARLRSVGCAEVDVVTMSVRAGNGSDTVDGEYPPGRRWREVTRRLSTIYVALIFLSRRRDRGRGTSMGRGTHPAHVRQQRRLIELQSRLRGFCRVDRRLRPHRACAGVRARDGMSSTATSSKANVDSFGKIVFLHVHSCF